MTPLENRLRTAAADAFPPTPDLAGQWAVQSVSQTDSTAQPVRRARPTRPRRLALALLLIALLLTATALAIPSIRRAIGISSHVNVVVVNVLPSLPPPPKPVPQTIRTKGRFLIKYTTPDTHIHRLHTHDAKGAFLEGGRHMLVVIKPGGNPILLSEDTGNTLVFERHGTVTRINGVKNLHTARSRMRSPAP